MTKVRARILCLESTDPYQNLAVEQALLEGCPAHTVLLLLWQNAHTVVIGRHQNAWRECNLAALEADGGRLARRITGGGAVYHDMGNLNFSFIASDGVYNRQRQTGVVLSCVQALGIPAAFSGRNDLTADGAKFSGHAYLHGRQASLHHGTLLVSADMGKLAGYLNPDPEKMKSHAVASVRARVVNLTSFVPTLDVAALQRALACAFEGEYGGARPLQREEWDNVRAQALARRNSSFEWRVGRSPAGDAVLRRRFDWGSLELRLTVSGGVVQQAQAYSDAMDVALAEGLPALLAGCRYTGAQLAGAVRRGDTPAHDQLGDWLEGAV